MAETEAKMMSVHQLNQAVKGWIEKLGTIWVEGQLLQLKSSPNWAFAYATLRDPSREDSVRITFRPQLLQQLPALPQDGDRVRVWAKPSFYAKNGDFQLWVSKIQPVGIGELLAQIEQLRANLRSQGLFDVARKRPLPFLPRNIGLITSRGSDGERDVLSIAKERWPEVRFSVRNTLVQGAGAVPAIISALQDLDADPSVDVIIIARGGGAMETLLPFSDEALVRAVADAQTPVVSAIGHDRDRPILDDVADLRAATPTDAAKRVVPDVVAERALVSDLRARAAAALRGWVQREQRTIEALRSRPVLAQPMRTIDHHRQEVSQAVGAMRREVRYLLSHEQQLTGALRAQLQVLGPAATLQRGYAIVQVVPRDGSEPEVVSSYAMSPPGSQLRIRVADGSIVAAAMQQAPAD